MFHYKNWYQLQLSNEKEETNNKPHNRSYLKSIQISILFLYNCNKL